MKHTSISTNQMMLPGVELAWCKCGCGQSFMRVARGRRREYLNKTHKKREARRLKKERQTETTARMTPKGYLYLHSADKREFEALWAEFDACERAIITLLCDTGFHPAEVLSAMRGLFESGRIK